MPKLVEVYSAADGVEAHFLCNLLEDHGIEARVVGEAMPGLGGAIPFGTAVAPRIWTDSESASQARELIEAWEFERRGGRPAQVNPTLQFSLKTLFIVTTICAVATAVYLLVHDQPWLGFAMGTVWYVLLLALFATAWIRKRISKQRNADSPDD